MIQFLKYHLNTLIDIWLAPLYFHFGHYGWFISLASFFSETGIGYALLILSFSFLTSLAIYKDEKFQAYFSKFQKKATETINNSPLLSQIFLEINKILSLINSITSFFKKK